MRAVFTLVTIIFIACVTVTVKSFKEVPLEYVEMFEDLNLNERTDVENSEREICTTAEDPPTSYGAIDDKPNSSNPFKLNISFKKSENEENGNKEQQKEQSSDEVLNETRDRPSLRQYLLTIIFMPKSLRLLCVTNLLCWMAHVCYSLYFTDFVGESVFLGDPKAPTGSIQYELYNAGIRFGCWGMAMYSLSCALYSMVIENLIRTYGYVHIIDRKT